MEDLNIILQLGIQALVIVFVLSLLLSVLSIWMGSKLIKSPYDSLSSAIKANFFCLMINAVLGLINSGFAWLGGQYEAANLFLLIIGIILWLIGLFSCFMITKNIYDLSYLRTIGLIVVTFIIYIALTVGAGFATLKFGGQLIQNYIPNDFLDSFEESVDQSDDTPSSSIEINSETETESSTSNETNEIPSPSKGPKIPRIPTQ